MYVVTPFMRLGDWHEQFLIREKFQLVESRTEGENRNAQPHHQAGFNQAVSQKKENFLIEINFWRCSFYIPS